GDAIVVVLNDPVEVDDAPARALRMAWEMRERGRELAADWEKRGWRMPLRIGAATGHATIGAIGFEERLDYGVVGRMSRLTAALCAAGDHALHPRVQGSPTQDVTTCQTFQDSTIFI